MKFLLLSQFAGAPEYGMVFRNYTWGKELVAQGHEVTIIGAAYSHMRTKQPETTGNITEEYIDGIRYLWVKNMKYSQSSAISRIMAMLSFALKTYFKKLPLDDHYDAIIISSPQPFMIYLALKLKNKFNAKLIYDIRDLWPLTLTEIGGVSTKNPAIWMMDKAQKTSCKNADLVTAVPKGCEGYLKQQGLNDNSFYHISNGITDDGLNPQSIELLPQQHIDTIENLKKQNKFIIGYAGAIGLANCLHTMIESLSGTNPDIHIVLMGHGNYEQTLKDLAKQLNVSDRVHFLPPVKRPQVDDFLNRIDVAYLGFRKAKLYEMGVSPTKLNDYMAAEKPILYSVDEPNDPVEQSGGGISCPAEDINAIRHAMQSLSETDKQGLKEMGQLNKEWLSKNQRVSDQMKKIVQHLSN